MRRPAESMSQRQLVHELVFQIDHAIAHPNDRSQAMARLRELVANHPRGMRSRHVIHNLGTRRVRLLETWGVR